MWAGVFDFGWFLNSEPGFWILKFYEILPFVSQMLVDSGGF